MLTFACATIACLSMQLGIREIIADDGRNVLVRRRFHDDVYICKRSSNYYECSEFSQYDPRAPKPWENY
jgi:hypothetical protein